MTDNKNEPQTKRAHNKAKKSKLNIFICVICLVAVVAGIFYIWHKNTKKFQPQLDVSSAVGIVDVDRLLLEHENYSKLLKLQDEKLNILSRLKTYITDDESIQPPEVNPAPDVFSQVVEQQDNLRQIKLRQQLKEESAVKENEIRSNLASEKNEVIRKINDRFYNAILNATIKLDNADNLKLSQSEREDLLAQLDYLKKQRGMAVAEIEQKFNLRVAEELMAWRSSREQELGLMDMAKHEEDVADSKAKQQQEQERDNQYLQDRMQMMKARKNDSERLLVLLHTKDNEIELLKKSMLKDIANKATKIAVQKHLKLVISNVPMSFNFFGSPEVDVFDSKFLDGMVVGVDAIDITEDILTEMQSDKAKVADINK